MKNKNHSGIEIDADEVLPKIQAVLRDENYNSFDDGSTSDVIRMSLSKIDLMITAIIDMMEHGEITDNETGALFHEYYRLREAIKVREESHSKVWGLAIRGLDPEVS